MVSVSCLVDKNFVVARQFQVISKVTEDKEELGM